MYNILFCSAGRRVKLLKDFKETIGKNGKIVVAENSVYAPSRYVADISYTVPPIDSPKYIEEILMICKKEEIKAIFTLIDPEIELLAKNKDVFNKEGIKVFTPSEESADLCFDKYKMYNFLKKNDINTTLTFGDIEEFKEYYSQGKIEFPVFVKPRTGSGSVGAKKINTMSELEEAMNNNPMLIIQEYMNGIDLDADVYVDTISRKAVSIFSKKKIETKIGGASKTISFKDEKLFEFIKKIIPLFDFYGTIDMDFFYKDGKYYLSEINPRFGGAYIHAYGAGVNFPRMVLNNIDGIENEENIGKYEENIAMLMYDDIIIEKIV